MPKLPRMHDLTNCADSHGKCWHRRPRCLLAASVLLGADAAARKERSVQSRQQVKHERKACRNIHHIR